MDCSELVSRYLKEVGIFDKVPDFQTNHMAKKETFEKLCGGKVQLMKGSEIVQKEGKKNTFIPQPGDIFVWRREPSEKNPNGDGHTGVVLSYDANEDVVEALGIVGSADDSRNKNAPVNNTRISKYSRTGKALTQHDGWVGYYRPIL